MKSVRCLFKSEMLTNLVKDICGDDLWGHGLELLDNSFNIVNHINIAALEKHKVVIMCQSQRHYEELLRLGVCEHVSVSAEQPTAETIIKLLNDDNTTGVAVFIGYTNPMSISGIDDIIYISSDDNYRKDIADIRLSGKEESTVIYAIEEVAMTYTNPKVDVDYIFEFVEEMSSISCDVLEEIEETPFVKEEPVYFEEQCDSPCFIHVDYTKKKLGRKKKKKLKKLGLL